MVKEFDDVPHVETVELSDGEVEGVAVVVPEDDRDVVTVEDTLTVPVEDIERVTETDVVAEVVCVIVPVVVADSDTVAHDEAETL